MPTFSLFTSSMSPRAMSPRAMFTPASATSPRAAAKRAIATRSNRLLLGVALAGLILESVLSHPALATSKVSLFKVITAKDEIVIGVDDDQLATFGEKNAGGIARHLAQHGTLTAWQYGVRKAEAGALEQAPLRQVGLMSADALRVEPYTTPLKIVPLPDMTGQ